MSIQNQAINSYYRSAKEVALLESDPKVVEYLRAVRERESAKKDAIAEMAKLKISRTKDCSEYRDYKFGDIQVELRTTKTHYEEKIVEAHDTTSNYISIK